MSTSFSTRFGYTGGHVNAFSRAQFFLLGGKSKSNNRQRGDILRFIHLVALQPGFA